jgi:hypothetical protein
VYNFTTRRVEEATPDMFISLHTGYPYPEREIEEIRQSPAGRGLRDVLVRARNWEHTPLGDRTRYPPDITRDLEAIAGEPAFELVRTMHDSFTPNAPDGESAGGWPVTVFRVLKVPAAAASRSAENFLVDTGTDGENGKGVLWEAKKRTFGQYATEIPLTMLVKDPPDTENATPALYDLRGVRFTGAPESERTYTMKSMWIKNLADRATVFKGRGLYMDNVKFIIPSIFCLSTNVAVNFTSIDGGVRRRGIGVSWPVSFKTKPNGPMERKRHAEDIKSAAFYTPLRVAGFLYSIFTTHDVWFSDGQDGLSFRPPAVQEATMQLLVTECAELITQILDEQMEECQPRDATSKIQFVRTAREFVRRELAADRLDEAMFNKAVECMIAFKIPVGSTPRVQRVASRQWMRFKGPSGA